uniref:SFRICE_003115 n=1 Tax=Spodoptera frugiperda TaxID=7108 RepID=A0A2H1WZR6_SPOFR
MPLKRVGHRKLYKERSGRKVGWSLPCSGTTMQLSTLFLVATPNASSR